MGCHVSSTAWQIMQWFINVLYSVKVYLQDSQPTYGVFKPLLETGCSVYEYVTW